LTQNYFPPFDYMRLLMESAAELGFCRLSLLASRCRIWPFCGLGADWVPTKIACVPALRPLGETALLPTPEQHAACGLRRKGAARPSGMGLRPPFPRRAAAGQQRGMGSWVGVWEPALAVKGPTLGLSTPLGACSCGGRR
jgi:hypothetical protein